MVSNILLQNHFVFSVAHTPRSANTLHLVGHTQNKIYGMGVWRDTTKLLILTATTNNWEENCCPKKENAKIEIYPNYSCTYFYLSSYLHSSQGCVKQHKEKKWVFSQKKMWLKPHFWGFEWPEGEFMTVAGKNAEIVDIPSSRIFSRGCGES